MGAAFVSIAWTTYSRCYRVGLSGVHARLGVFHRHDATLRWQDIAVVESTQSFFGQLFNVGTVALSSAGTGGVDVVLAGIAGPKRVRDLIQQRRAGAGTPA